MRIRITVQPAHGAGARGARRRGATRVRQQPSSLRHRAGSHVVVDSSLVPGRTGVGMPPLPEGAVELELAELDGRRLLPAS